LSGFLLRRGFDHETVRKTVATLWEEQQGDLTTKAIEEEHGEAD